MINILLLFLILVSYLDFVSENLQKMNDVKLSEIAQKLWDSDMNRFKHGKDFEIDLQKPVLRQEVGYKDRCERPLFKYLNEDVLIQRPTYQKFISLLDNYYTDVGKREVVTIEELREQDAFLDACLDTSVMHEAYRFLINEKMVKNDMREFKNLLTAIWFQMYNRKSSNRVHDSSAFEHVFIGEKNEEGVIGCHSWLQYYLLEKRKETDYYGYISHLCSYSTKDKSSPDMITMQFFRDGSVKAVGGFLLGVSPEFELALYTILYLCGTSESTRLNFANMSIKFYCYKMQRYGRQVLSTIYPTKI